MPSMVLPSGRTPAVSAAPAAAAHRSVSPGRPTSANSSAPCAATLGVLLDEAVRLEPLHPAQHGVGAPAGPDGAGDLQHEAGRHDRRRRPPGHGRWRPRVPVRLAPCRRPEVEGRHHVGLPTPQLRRQQLSEELVVAVPLPPPVERDHEQVPTLQTLQHLGRIASCRVSRRTADRTWCRGWSCGSGTAPRRPTPGRGTPSAGSRP